ncbi:MAG TPA: efflux RND transporter permease subunit [Methylovirgula sp.]
MKFNVSAWSIRKPLPAILFALIALTLGAVSFVKLPVTLLPNVDPSIVTVVVTKVGAAPADLERDVTRPIENSISDAAGVKHVISQVSDGVSATTVTFALDVNSDVALKEVTDAVARVRSSLPNGVSEVKVKRVDAIGLGILTYAAESGSKSPQELSAFVDDVIIHRLQDIKGISSVERIGGDEREIRITYHPERLQALGITPAQVSDQLRALGESSAAPKSLADLNAALIKHPNGSPARLDSLATVSDTIATAHRFARLNSEPIVAFSILRAKGASDVTVSKEVDKALAQIGAEHPDVKVQMIDTSVRYTEGNYDSAMHTLFEGAALAVIVVFLFLRDFRATVIAAIALPLSIVPAFFVMSILGFSLNLVSLLAITLATGILVDDAIVEIENIVRHMRMGKSAYQAAMDAAQEIGLAVIAISLTIVAVFAPVSFIGNIAGQYFKQFGLTVAAEVIFSLLAARLITPMLAAYFLKPHKQDDREGGMTKRYGSLVEWSVVHRYKTVVIGFVLFAASILSITSNLVSRDFQPTQDSGRSHLAVELPAKSTLDETRKATDRVTALLLKHPEVTSVFVDGGRISPGMPEERKAQLTVNYVPKANRKLSVLQLQALINKDLDAIPGIEHWFVDDYGTRPVSRIFTGTNSAEVTKFANDLAKEMQKNKLISNIVASSSPVGPQLRVDPAEGAMDKAGVSHESLDETIKIATFGDAAPAVANLSLDGHLIPIRAEFDQRARDPRMLATLKVPSDSGDPVPLGKIAHISVADGPLNISRFDGDHSATVQADLVGNAALGDVEAALDKMPLMQHPPAGIKVRKSPSTEAMEDLSGGFAEAMRNGLIMVYVVLVLLFASFLQPVTILFSLPLSIGGAILALLITGRPLSMPVIIGILMLMGIVTKNAIMIVDFSTSAMATGMPRTKAIVEAGKKRARPIIMTTIAMIAGMVPSALGFGAGAEFRSPMAVAVIGGLLVSTLLSLLFVPAFFAVMDDAKLGLIAGWHAFAAFFRGKLQPRTDRAIDIKPLREPAE